VVTPYDPDQDHECFTNPDTRTHTNPATATHTNT